MDKIKKVRKHKIEPGSEDEKTICRSIEQCLSIKQITCIVNETRASRNLSKLSWSCIQNYVATSPFIVRFARGHKKSGSSDKESSWAIARLAMLIVFIPNEFVPKRI